MLRTSNGLHLPRRLLAFLAQALAAQVLAGALLFAVPALAQRSPPGGHSIFGGIGGIVRGSYGVKATSTTGGLGTIYLPKPNIVYVVPLSVTNYAESSDFTLQSNGAILINTTGLYRIGECIDWPGQYGVDIDLRHYGIGRLLRGQSLGSASGNDLIQAKNAPYDQLATYEVPGSNPPAFSRAQLAHWSPGTIAAGAFVTMDVAMPQAGVLVAGDVAEVGDTALTDASLGAAANNAITIEGKVIGPDLVRVLVRNSGPGSVTVPSGTVNILAKSAVNQLGNSADAWTVIQTPTTLLYAGEQIFGNFMSKTPGDFIQVTNQTYLQIELIAKKTD